MNPRLLDIDRTPLKRLTVVFVVWKLVLLLISIAAPGPGYDTSSTLLDLGQRPSSFSSDVLAKFVRWDAIYFTQIAQRGHVYEQEWAFGVGLTTTLRWLAKRLFLSRGLRPELYQVTITGIFLSHLMHYLSTVLVFYLASVVLAVPTEERRRGRSPAASSLPAPSRVPALSAVLYIFSPAGIILSVPYTEALFAFRNLLGLLVYIVALRSPPNSSVITKALLTILSGLIFSTATAVRSNGILSGIPVLLAFLSQLYHVTTTFVFPPRTIVHLGSLLIAGLLIAAGQILPQVPAYQQFCNSSSSPPRPWCSYTIPSIFAFAQQEYWNVGFLNYWTAGNIPLFALAAPAITLLTYSSYSGLRQVVGRNTLTVKTSTSKTFNDTSGIVALALPQLVLAITALFSFHVQIITRIASGYPWWYIWVAQWIVDEEEKKQHRPNESESEPQSEPESEPESELESELESEDDQDEKTKKPFTNVPAKLQGKDPRPALTNLKPKPSWVVRWMVMYALIHAALYASFLPPA